MRVLAATALAALALSGCAAGSGATGSTSGGGAPDDPRNLWPEARTGASGSATQKDVLENYLHRAVCSGSMTLRDAQRTIKRNWQAAYLETTG